MKWMCNAWLLQTRHCPDGARAHTGYAYGPLDERSGCPRQHPPRPLLCSRLPDRTLGALVRCSQPYAHGEDAHEVTRLLLAPCTMLSVTQHVLLAHTHTHPHTHTHERRGSASASDGVMLVSCAWFQARSMVICDGCYIQPWCRSFALASDVSGPSLAAHQGSAPAPAEPAPRLILLLHILNTSDGGGRRPQTGATIGSSLIGNSNALRRPVAGRSL